MVTRNQCGGGGAADWWHGLPARVRRRVSAVPPEPVGQLLLDPPQTPDPPAAWPLAADLLRLAAALLAVWAALVAVLLVALTFLSGGPLPVPGR